MGSLAWSGSRAGGNVRGERARPEFRLEGAKAGVQGRRVRVRRANPRGIAGVGRGESGADEGLRALWLGIPSWIGVARKASAESLRARARKVFFQAKRWKKRARKSLHVAVNEQT